MHLMEIYSIFFIFVNLMPFKSSLSEQCFLISSSFYARNFMCHLFIHRVAPRSPMHLHVTLHFFQRFSALSLLVNHKAEVVKETWINILPILHALSSFFVSVVVVIFLILYVCVYNFSYFTFSNYLLIIC